MLLETHSPVFYRANIADTSCYSEKGAVAGNRSTYVFTCVNFELTPAETHLPVFLTCVNSGQTPGLSRGQGGVAEEGFMHLSPGEGWSQLPADAAAAQEVQGRRRQPSVRLSFLLHVLAVVFDCVPVTGLVGSSH